MNRKSNEKQSKTRFEMLDIPNRKRYLELLNKLRERTQKIVIVQIDGAIKNDPIVNAAWNMLHLEKKETVSEWLGTKANAGRGAVMHTFSVTQNRKEFFDFLALFDSFWDGIESVADEYDEESEFDDIAFLDAAGKPLFFSTTHEREFNIREDLIQ